MSDEISKKYRIGDRIASVIQQNIRYQKWVDCPACEGSGETCDYQGESKKYYPAVSCGWCGGSGRSSIGQRSVRM